MANCSYCIFKKTSMILSFSRRLDILFKMRLQMNFNFQTLMSTNPA